MATPLSTPTSFDFLFRFLELNFQTKVEQERTLTDDIIMCTKFDILNHDGFLNSGGCISVNFWRF